ncbi:MAG: AraC family ligand binding domain-containing protein [Succinivibrio sp.]
MKNIIRITELGNCEHIAGSGMVTIPEHTHKSFTVVLISSGELEISINSQKMEVASGCAIVLPPNNALSLSSKRVFIPLSVSTQRSLLTYVQRYSLAFCFSG